MNKVSASLVFLLFFLCVISGSGQSPKPFFNGVANRLAFLWEIDPREISDNTATSQYTEAVHKTVETVKVLMNAASELIRKRDL